MTSPDPERIAAVDLGSNSFHMVIGRLVNGEPVVIDRLREQVRLAEGLDGDGRLGGEALERALQCLTLIGQRLKGIPPQYVRVVGTNTWRAARNASEVLSRAEEALGHAVEVISGREEARLIYLGVAHSLSDDYGTRLVVDIGGGSTECILGSRFEPLEAHSLYMGCVSWSRRFFPGGAIDRARMDEAILAARLELKPLRRAFQETGWQEAVGASGTIRAVAATLRAAGWASGGIDVDGLRSLRSHLLEVGHAERVQLEGLKPERAPVFAGGVAILLALFKSLKVQHMAVSSGALREGVLYDLLGRIQHEDVRERTIANFQESFQVEREQALRVEGTALALLRRVADAWDLASQEAERMLSWAARLHELGLAVSYSHHNRHGGYLIANSEMQGFSQEDRHVLAAIVASHRRKVRAEVFAELRGHRVHLAQRLAVLLRLAVVLNRGRRRPSHLPTTIDAHRRGLRLVFPTAWIEEHPLTAPRPGRADGSGGGLGREAEARFSRLIRSGSARHGPFRPRVHLSPAARRSSARSLQR